MTYSFSLFKEKLRILGIIKIEREMGFILILKLEFWQFKILFELYNLYNLWGLFYILFKESFILFVDSETKNRKCGPGWLVISCLVQVTEFNKLVPAPIFDWVPKPCTGCRNNNRNLKLSVFSYYAYWWTSILVKVWVNNNKGKVLWLCFDYTWSWICSVTQRYF